MSYDNKLREEELKNKVAQDYFAAFDTTKIIGNIDFCIAIRQEKPSLFETEYLLWAEAKAGVKKDLLESFVQLILTIGKARTFDHHLPPAFLGAFDAAKMAFIPYNAILDVLYQNDFNWNVTPSNHDSREFHQLYDLAREELEKNVYIFHFGRDDKELHRFIIDNFRPGKTRVASVRINKNNFTSIYQKWLDEVKPTIAISSWDDAKHVGIIDADFYLADILSEHNTTLRDRLYVVLRGDHYELERRINALGLFSKQEAGFTDKGKAHAQFWNKYARPPKRDYWDYIIERRDLLVPQDVRERKGSFFTPRQWVELSQQYLADTLGEDWQDEYVIWDCCAGTGNLLNGLTNKYNIWASTLDQADVDVMHSRIRNGANLLDSHVFRFDFLNDDFSLLPQGLQDIINNPECRKKLVIYINPPYAEAGNARTNSGAGENRTGVAATMIREKYKDSLGKASNELFAQFFARIVREISGSVLAEFSKLKILQGPNFSKFRMHFNAKLERLFLVPANTFDNVSGRFPIGFKIWDTNKKIEFLEAKADVFGADGAYIMAKTISSYKNSKYIIDWLREYYDKQGEFISYLRMTSTDFQNQNSVFLTLKPSPNDFKQVRITTVSKKNILQVAVYFAVRLCIEATWLNDRDQFLYPNDDWKNDAVFQSDCLIYTLFHGQNRISCRHGANHWIPFTEAEVNACDNFESHFMSDYLAGKRVSNKDNNDLFGIYGADGNERIQFSNEARAVLDAGRELWRYYHAQPNIDINAALYDIKAYFQGWKTTTAGRQMMNPTSADERYNQLIANLRGALRHLAQAIEPKVYEYGFLKK